MEKKRDVFIKVLHETLGAKWRSLARELGFSPTDVDSIIERNQRDLQEQIHEFFDTWKQREGHDATLLKLQEAVRRHFDLRSLLADPSGGRVMNNQQDWTCAASQILKLSPSCIDDIERGGNDSLKKEIESLWNLETKDPFIVIDCVETSSSTMPSMTGVHCWCGQAAVLLTAKKKKNGNEDRQFFKCLQKVGGHCQKRGGCRFFLWADQVSSMAPGPSGSSGPPPPPPPSVHSHSTADSSRHPGSQKRSRKVVPSHSTPKVKENIVCECGQQAVRRTVKKNGPTKGKTFYNCSKPVGSQCKFYKWADELSGAEDSHTHLSGAGRKRAAPSDSDCKQSGYPKRPRPLTKRTDGNCC